MQRTLVSLVLISTTLAAPACSDAPTRELDLLPASPNADGCAGKCDDLTSDAPLFDYIVVGSGAGGGPLASRLARAGKRVLLLEAGRDAGDKLAYQIPAFHGAATETPDLAWWYWVEHYTDPTQRARDTKLQPKGILYPRGGALGGSTAVNAQITVLPPPSDWHRIADLTGDESWRPEEMDKYYGRVKEWLAVERPDATLALGDYKILSILVAAVIEYVNSGRPGPAFNLLDLPRNLQQLKNLMARDLNEDKRHGSVEGLYSFPLATRDGMRSGTRDFIVSTVREGYPLTVKTQALVTKVLFSDQVDERGQPIAIGVEYLDGANLYQAEFAPSTKEAPTRRAYVRDEVILSAGAFNTPQLLKLSGIGPAEELEALGIPVLVDLPGVGENLQDRYEVGVVGEVSSDFAILKGCTFGKPNDPCLADWLHGRGVYESNGAIASILMRSSPDQAEPDLHIFGVPGVFKGYKPGYSVEATADKRHFTWVILKAHTENTAGTVKLKSANPRERPAVHFHYFDDGDVDQGQDVNDLTAVVNAVELVRKIGKKADAVPFFGDYREVWPGPAADSRAKIGQWIKDEAWGHHASCSAKIGGDDDAMAVLDSEFRVRGVSSLRVVDASVFPRIPGTFIVLSVYMVSEKAADVILGAN